MEVTEDISKDDFPFKKMNINSETRFLKHEASINKFKKMKFQLKRFRSMDIGS